MLLGFGPIAFALWRGWPWSWWWLGIVIPLVLWRQLGAMALEDGDAHLGSKMVCYVVILISCAACIAISYWKP